MLGLWHLGQIALQVLVISDVAWCGNTTQFLARFFSLVLMEIQVDIWLYFAPILGQVKPRATSTGGSKYFRKCSHSSRSHDHWKLPTATSGLCEATQIFRWESSAPSELIASQILRFYFFIDETFPSCGARSSNEEPSLQELDLRRWSFVQSTVVGLKSTQANRY